MGVDESDYKKFRSCYKQLRSSNRFLATSSSKGETQKGKVGRFQANPRGFGFVKPEPSDGGEDIFIPAGQGGGALTGDLVVVNLTSSGRRGGSSRAGQVVEVLERGLKRVVGTLELAGGSGLVHPEGRNLDTPVLILELEADATEGSRVVAEVVEYPSAEGMMPIGEIREVLGRAGELEPETLTIIRAYDLPEEFSPEVLEDARAIAAAFDPDDFGDREDLTDLQIVTIDPKDARDFDDAISLSHNDDGTTTLGVHIADVSHFVPEGSVLDEEARQRGTSVYFPRRVVPMLPESLSAGVCCLKQDERRFAKSVFITYDSRGEVLRTRHTESVIRSRQRLTYEQAQEICDGDGGFSAETKSLVRNMERLARLVAARRRRAGMLHLDLPDVDLVLDEKGRVIGANPTGSQFSHTIIEMFMIEANEAVAALFADLGVPAVRRIHPPPDEESYGLLRVLAQSSGYPLGPAQPTRHELQSLLAAVSDRPEGYAVNLALLRTFHQARYSIEHQGHFALASKHYCHFTSPIRRYPDLMIHRLLSRYLHKRSLVDDDEGEELEEVAVQLSELERRAESAEMELKQVLVLHYLSHHVGERFRGIITAVTDFGLFVQWPRFLVDGLLRLDDLPGGGWEVDLDQGRVTRRKGEEEIRLGTPLEVVIARVDVARRHLDLTVADGQVTTSDKTKSPSKRGKHRGSERRKGGRPQRFQRGRRRR